MVADFSGIESRGLAWISGQQSKIDAWSRFDQTGDLADDPYVQIAARCGLTGEGARNIGKVIDLAFGFGGGIGAWKRTASEDDETDDDTAKRYKETWRTAHPRTVQFWYGLERQAIAAVRVTNPETVFPVGRVSYQFADPFLRLTLPSGRAISYPFAKIVGPNQFGNLQLTFLDNAGGKFTDCRFGQGAWFGMLVENVVQAIARDLLAAALMRLEAAGYPVVLHVHDEVACEVPEGFGDLEEFKRIIVEAPEWAKGLPIAAKAREGLRFSKEDAPATSTEFTEAEAPCACSAEQTIEARPGAAYATADASLVNKTGACSFYGNNSLVHSHGDGNGYGSGERPWGRSVAEYIYRRERRTVSESCSHDGQAIPAVPLGRWPMAARETPRTKNSLPLAGVARGHRGDMDC
jgi:hypothetical protein